MIGLLLRWPLDKIFGPSPSWKRTGALGLLTLGVGIALAVLAGSVWWGAFGIGAVGGSAMLMFEAAKQAKREARGLPAEPPEETEAQMMAKYREHDREA